PIKARTIPMIKVDVRNCLAVITSRRCFLKICKSFLFKRIRAKTALVGIVFALILLNKKDLHIFRKHRREVITAKQLRTSTLII
ncbi:hypothetical protein PT041_08830, partial [Erysipelothrix rhusiopathiae]|nr:hypothetical protein [Erysipelothrix rhusiopathiae]